MTLLILQILFSIAEYLLGFPLAPPRCWFGLKNGPPYLTGRLYVVYRTESIVVNIIAVILQLIFLEQLAIQILIFAFTILLNYIVSNIVYYCELKKYIKELVKRLLSIEGYKNKETYELRRVLLEKYPDCSYDVCEIEKGLKEISRIQSKNSSQFDN